MPKAPTCVRPPSSASSSSSFSSSLASSSRSTPAGALPARSPSPALNTLDELAQADQAALFAPKPADSAARRRDLRAAMPFSRRNTAEKNERLQVRAAKLDAAESAIAQYLHLSCSDYAEQALRTLTETLRVGDTKAFQYLHDHQRHAAAKSLCKMLMGACAQDQDVRIQCLEEAVRLDDTIAMVHGRLAEAYLDAQRPYDAANSLACAIALQPGRSDHFQAMQRALRAIHAQAVATSTEPQGRAFVADLLGRLPAVPKAPG